MSAVTPILQFGTSRFLLAHADFFISQALAEGKAIGPITVVQTTGSADSAARVAALKTGGPYPVRIRGMEEGRVVDEDHLGHAIADALTASEDWATVRRLAMTARVILSNTGDRGYAPDPADGPDLAKDFSRVPKGFPTKLCMLLLERWQHHPQVPVSIFPCELVPRNGDRLKAIIRDLARQWSLPSGFVAYLDAQCRFANSLVDRIVSEPIQPVGAVAEPYALWAIERQAGLELPCIHPAIVVTDDLARYEDLKLHILNLGHTVLAELWHAGKRPDAETVREIMADATCRSRLEAVWRDEVLPVFAARGLGSEAHAYRDAVRDRFLNPFLAHRLSDIAGNHDEKKRRRLLPIVEQGRAAGHAQPILTAMLEAAHG